MTNTPKRLAGRILRAACAVCLGAAIGFGAHAQKRYDTGASDTEIKIGHIAPYSGPASAFGTTGKAAAAYFAKVNAEGGINGRKVNFISLDDGYNPAKTVEQARKLVEQDEVLLLFGSVGTAHNMAIQRYMNARKVPQLLVGSGATRFGDPKGFPWTMGWQPSYQTEGQIYARHILKTKPDAKVAILMQNDDFGKDFLKGFLDGLGEHAGRMVVSRSTYEINDPTVDSQMVGAKGSGADTFFCIAAPKVATQAIRKAADIGWKPAFYLTSNSGSVAAVIKPAGLENAIGLISSNYLRDPADATLAGVKEFEDYKAWMAKYYPAGDITDSLNAYGHAMAQTLEYVLRSAGDDLTRANIMKVASHMSFQPAMLYPGIDVKTSPDDFRPIEKVQLMRFNGTRFEPLGPVLGN